MSFDKNITMPGSQTQHVSIRGSDGLQGQDQLQKTTVNFNNKGNPSSNSIGRNEMMMVSDEESYQMGKTLEADQVLGLQIKMQDTHRLSAHSSAKFQESGGARQDELHEVGEYLGDGLIAPGKHAQIGTSRMLDIDSNKFTTKPS